MRTSHYINIEQAPGGFFIKLNEYAHTSEAPTGKWVVVTPEDLAAKLAAISELIAPIQQATVAE